jgi:amino acid adenylation domain-containing protein
LLSYSDEGLTLPELKVSRLPQSGGRVRFDLEMYLWQPAAREDSLRGTVVYSTELFDAATIGRLVCHFATLLEGIVADADQKISALPLLTEAERRQLLVEWNDTAVEYPGDKCVHQLFEEQVERMPGAVAVVFEGQELTYRELNDRANQLAHHLRSLGVRPETLVGLCLERSPGLVVGILGILKAGGAYLPLDADYPTQRLQFMLTDANVEFLVTQHELLVHLPASDCQVVCLDTDAAKIQVQPWSNPSLNVGADNLAYVMFTSGSTGQPKGVAIRHASIARLVFGNDYTIFGPDRVFLQLATVSFDASTFELWGALLHGAKLVIAPAGLPDFRQLEEVLKKNRVTTLWLTATLLNQVLEDYPQALSSVVEILTGGEALSVPHICKAQQTLGSNVQLINGYGPTESTTFATCYRIPSHIAPELESIPIGHPIANTQAYVLDKHCRPVPIGVPGELYIGGAGLARGYLNRPELTAERFVPNPFSDDPHSRLYRTGDLCRWRADGNLEFLGRIDDQVKLRGFRIELGEIEAVLNYHPSVAHTVVVMREDRPGDKRLVAYCVSARNAALNVADLTRHLHTRLPDFMVPSVFVPLEALPLMPSGKVNRRLLPAPDNMRPDLANGYVAPRDPFEEQLASVWCDVMGIRSIGIHDDFFAQGGHSLLAVRLMARIESAFGKKLPLATLFEHPTIAHMARILQQTSRFTKQSALVKIQGHGTRLPLFFSPSMGGEAFFCQPMARHLGTDQPIWSFQVPEHDGVRKPFVDIETMAAFFVNELTKSHSPGAYCLAGYSFGAAVALEMAQQLWARGNRVALVAILDWGFSTPRPRTIGRLLRSTWASCRNLPYWLTDDFLHTPAKNMLPRLLGEIREIARRLRDPWAPGQGISSSDDPWETPLPSEFQVLMETHLSALRKYQPRPYPGRITLFRARARALLSSGRERDLGWGRIAKGGVDVRMIPGTHLTMVQEPFVQILAHEMQRALEMATNEIS